jgi:hypothetical protein
MAFGGVQVNSSGANALRITGLTLAARVGAPDLTGAAADSGVLVTNTVGANQNQIPIAFGKGQGNWVAGDDAKVIIIPNDPDGTATATGSFVHLASTSISTQSTTIAAASNGIDLTQIGGILNVASTAGFATSGTIYVTTASGVAQKVTYSGTTGTTFTGCVPDAGGLLQTGGAVSSGNLVVVLHNKGAGASGSLLLSMIFEHSEIQ